ncbi:MAG: alpha/beta hydrolase family protein [Nitriliruptoraceae bacterium]
MPTRKLPRPTRRLALLGALVLLVLTAGTSTIVWLQPEPIDGFYRPPADLADAAPGELLRIEPFTRGVPDGVRGWRMLYRSQGHDGQPVAVSGLVLEPMEDTGPRPMVAIAHGSTGVAEDCAPTLSARPLASLPAVEEALEAGFVVAASDLPGLGTPGPHPYLLGDASAFAVLDAVRAAQDLATVDRDRLAIWGFSQGGHAALFAGEYAPSYAPELPLDGIVAFAPATDLAAIIEHGQGGLLGTLLVVNAVVAWAEAYDELELDDVLEEDSIPTALDLAGRCLDGLSLPASTIRSIQLRSALASLDDPGAQAWAPVLDANSPSGPLPAPLLVLQGAADPFVPPEITEAYVAARCADGEDVELRVVTGAEHFTLSWRTADDAVAWTQDRFVGEPTSSSCP